MSPEPPENGTVTYTYDSAHRVTSRIDAKGQKTTYVYDDYGRLASRRYYIPVNGQFEEQTDQAVTYHYDTNPFATTSNAWGRLAAVTFSNGFRYDYSYNQAGRVTSRNLHARTAYVRSEPYCCATEERFFDFPMAYQWDNEGRMTSVQYPAAAGGATYNYGFDDMGRLSSMTQGGNSVATATYGVAGELTTLWTANFGTETHTYNSMFQLTRIRAVDQSGPGVDLEYRYAAGQNNGRITQSVDWASGEEVTYTYDALQRLTKAETTGPQWGQAYSYDGFGNLTGKTVTKGSATTLSLAIDAATNRPGGRQLRRERKRADRNVGC